VKTMTFDKAAGIVANVVAGRKRLGRNYAPPYIMDDVLDALVVVHEHGNFDGLSKEEITKLKRQLAACQNREKARQNKGLDEINKRIDADVIAEATKAPAVQIDMFEVPEPESTLES
jgi:hypothetical protein